MVKRGNMYYSLEANPSENRVYFSMKLKTPSVAAIPNFESDWKKTVGELKSGFTILGDVREMEPHLPDVEELNVKIQQWLLQNGCKKVAQIAPINVAVSINKFSEKSGLKKILQGFHTVEAGTAWLNKP